MGGLLYLSFLSYFFKLVCYAQCISMHNYSRGGTALTIVVRHYCDTSLIWTYSQVGCKCCFYSQRATLLAPRSRCTQRSALAMKTTLMPHMRINPYKGSVVTVQIQILFHAVGRSFSPLGGS